MTLAEMYVARLQWPTHDITDGSCGIHRWSEWMWQVGPSWRDRSHRCGRAWWWWIRCSHLLQWREVQQMAQVFLTPDLIKSFQLSTDDVGVNQVVESAQAHALFTKTEHQMWSSDRVSGTATLTLFVQWCPDARLLRCSYVEAKHAETLKKGLLWEVHTDGIFPFAVNDYNYYWSGYFTWRPSLKKQVSFLMPALVSASCISTPARHRFASLRTFCRLLDSKFLRRRN